MSLPPSLPARSLPVSLLSTYGYPRSGGSTRPGGIEWKASTERGGKRDKSWMEMSARVKRDRIIQ